MSLWKGMFVRPSLIAIAILLASAASSRAASYTTIDAPGAIGFTSATGINDAGDVVGIFQQPGGTRSYSRTCAGYTVIHVPGADPHLGTHARDINNAGEIAGFYYFTVTFPDGSGSSPLGFVKSGDAYTTVAPPGSIATFVWGINDAGQLVGSYADGTGNHGFVKTGPVYTTIDVPGASDTYATGIDNAGQVVGIYVESPGDAPRLFMRNGAAFSTFDVPGSIFTNVWGINNVGQIVGSYSDMTGTHGFVKDGPSITTYDVPGAAGTEAFGINDAGQVVGSFFVAPGPFVVHGFATDLAADTTAPTATVSVSPAVLWPPNHKLVEIEVSATATDDCDPAPGIALVSVTSNEPADARADGNSEPDIVITNGRIFLRAERSGRGDARVYTLTYRATDGTGNSATKTATVTVPHQQP
jgi:uncharacterized membrane protein